MILLYFQLFTVIAVLPLILMVIINDSHLDFWECYKACGISILVFLTVAAVIVWVIYCIMSVLGWA